MSSYLEYARETLRAPAFEYDVQERIFKIGDQKLTLEEETLARDPGQIVAEQPQTNDLNEAAICLNVFGNPISTPAFRGWLGQLRIRPILFQPVRFSTVSVIQEISTEFSAAPSDAKGGYMGYDFVITQDSHARLNTFGDCACLGPNPSGLMVEAKDWEQGYCEYTFHNIDTHVQLWSLLAGLGHLAALSADGMDK